MILFSVKSACRIIPLTHAPTHTFTEDTKDIQGCHNNACMDAYIYTDTTNSLNFPTALMT